MTPEELAAIEARAKAAEQHPDALTVIAPGEYASARQIADHHARTDIPALVAEVKKWRDGFERADTHLIAVVAERDALMAEVKRLRDALAEIRDFSDVETDADDPFQNVHVLARAALTQEPSND